MIYSYNGNPLKYNGYCFSGYSNPEPEGYFNNFYGINENTFKNVSGAAGYSTELTFIPYIPGKCNDGEQIYFYLMSGDDYPGGVQFAVGLYKSFDDDYKHFSAGKSIIGSWSRHDSSQWPSVSDNFVNRSYSAIPDTVLSASIFKTPLVWDSSIADGIYIDWLHDNRDGYKSVFASYNRSSNESFASTDANVAYKLFSKTTAEGVGFTPGISGQYLYWSTSSYLT